MRTLQRSTVRSARGLRAQLLRQPRRHASGSHGAEHSHGHGAPKNESLGSGFYIALAALPASFALYKLSRQGPGNEQPYLTRLITDTYNGYKTKWAQRNDMHTQMVEQAAHDRILFLDESNRNVRHVDLRFPEQFNGGSPWSVPAGQGSVNIDQIVAKYQKEANEEQEKRMQQLKDNKVPAEQPVDRLTRVSPAVRTG